MRRIFSQNKPAAEDESQVLTMLLAGHGIFEPDTQKITPIPISSIIETAQKSKSQPIVLKQIHRLENVNALLTEKSLEVGLQGLTIVYGGFGAGKSG